MLFLMSFSADSGVAGGDRRPVSGRRWLLALGLFLLAPYIGEFVLGNQPITAFPTLVLLAPMYGGGALLIREVARRTTGGWPVIIVLAAAYALLEEGPIDQMLFNPAYLGLDSFAEQAPIPGLGISASLTQASLTLHTVWSICVPIAIIEAFDSEVPRPWLGKVGLAVNSAVFVLGSTALALMQFAQFRFVASPIQFGVVGAVIVALIAVALLIGRRPAAPVRPGRPRAPRAALVGAAAFGLSSIYWLADLIVPWFAGPWVSIGCWVVLVTGCAILLARCSQRPGWGRAHRLAVAGGALLTYLWAAFVHSAYLAVPRPIGLLGNVVFGAGAVAILALAIRADRHHRVAGSDDDESEDDEVVGAGA
jgi:hypothetical protein